MGDKSKIEWCTSTWNPVVGCSVVSPGCTNCYAMRVAGRLQKINRTGGSGTNYVNHYDGTTRETSKGKHVWIGKVALAPEKTLLQPLRWKHPRIIFVNSMGDLFHESVPDAWIDHVFAVIALASQHTFIILTKRAKRMRSWFEGDEDTDDAFTRILSVASSMMEDGDLWWTFLHQQGWPLPNVILGVSAERQQEADERIPDLLVTPAAKRFVSAEPLLGAIDFRQIRIADEPHARTHDTLTGYSSDTPYALIAKHLPDRFGRGRLDWVIVGGESGPGARPMHPDWARSIRDQCAASNIPFFFKQWGEFIVPYDGERACRVCGCTEYFACAPYSCSWIEADLCSECDGKPAPAERAVKYARVGKKQAGRLLDGVEHNAFPTIK